MLVIRFLTASCFDSHRVSFTCLTLRSLAPRTFAAALRDADQFAHFQEYRWSCSRWSLNIAMYGRSFDASLQARARLCAAQCSLKNHGHSSNSCFATPCCFPVINAVPLVSRPKIRFAGMPFICMMVLLFHQKGRLGPGTGGRVSPHRQSIQRATFVATVNFPWLLEEHFRSLLIRELGHLWPID